MDATLNSNNSNTGASSSNTTTFNLTNTASTNVSNSSTTSNAMNLSVDTGHNTAANNTQVGAVTTGDADLGWNVVTKDNGFDASAVVPAGGSVTLNASNNSTGSGSTNSTTLTNNASTTLRVTNTSSVSNSVSANVSTGGNVVNGNTTAGALTTGSVHIAVSFGTASNGATLPGAPVVTPTGPTTGVDQPVLLGLGGAPTGTLAVASTPLGLGGAGYFPSGASFGTEVLVTLIAAAVISFAVPALMKHFRSRVMALVPVKGIHA